MLLLLLMMITKCDGELRKAATEVHNFKNIRHYNIRCLSGLNGIVWEWTEGEK
jgi:hypothetical protein